MRHYFRRVIPGRRAFKWTAALLGILILAVVVFVRFFLDEHLRQTIEQNVNSSLTGYTVRIDKLRFHPIGFSLELIDTTILQDAHPEPPVAHVPVLSASVHWRALLHGRLVSDFVIDRPKLYIDLKQARQEVREKMSPAERGWQDALEEIYPLKVNLFNVRDADVTYTDQGPFKPLHLSKLNFEAENIRNVHSKENAYPSEVHLRTVAFDTGTIAFDGNADFLAKPHPGIKGGVSLSHIELDYFRPITNRYNVSVRNGVFSSDGLVEYAPSKKTVDVKHVTIQGVAVDYVHMAKTAAQEQQVAEQVATTAKDLNNKPEVLVKLNQIDIRRSRLGFVNKAVTPEYQLFFTDANIRVENLTNQSAEGRAVGTFAGNFMDSGKTVVNVAFQPKAKQGGDLDLKLSMDGTDMTSLNPLLLNAANFDVNEGSFSLYSEARVRDGQVNGYIKPLFKNLDVYDAEKDADKSFGQKLKQGLIGAVAWILSNRPRNEVATTITLTGRIDSPQYSNWEAFVGMLKNAFITAIRPGFKDREQAEPAPAKEGSAPQPS
ncbi:MAG TPA: DUF748 domain-containing protein [Candidatus Binatia bacterium]|jgi:hypothetical protein